MKHQKIGGVVATAVALTAIGTGTGAPALAATHAAKAAIASAPGAFVPLAPVRVLDTRSGLGAAKHKVAAQGTVSVTVTGAHGVPSTGVSAVVLNVTAANTAGSGFITAYPGGTVKPGASNLNYAKGQTVANLVTVGVGATGAVTFFNGSSGTVDLLADVAGYYIGGTAIDPGMFVSTAPTRLLDTRTGRGAAKHPVAGGDTINLVVGTGTPVPAGAKAVVLNVTATTVTKSGFVTVFPTGATKPAASNLNYTAGRTVPNLVTVGLGTGSSVSLYNGSTGSANLVADVAGYYLAGTAAKAGAFVPVTPARILDTRNRIGTPDNQAIDPTFDVGLQTVNVGGIPVDNVGAVVANVTVVSPTSTGFVTVSPTNPSRPTVSNINHAAGQTIANLTIVPPGLCSKATFYNGSAGSTHLLADAAGYFLAKDAAGNGSPAKTARALGGNAEGELADGTTTDRATPVSVLSLKDTKQITSEGLGLTGDGGVWAWGPEELAPLYANKPGVTDEGQGNCSVPQRLSGFSNNIMVAVAGSPSDGYAIDLNGDVWSWGFNDAGQLGRGTIGVDDFAPAKIPFAGNHNYTAITAGFALSDDGTVWGWGDNSDGRLGVDPASLSGTLAPIQVAPATLTGITGLGQGIAQYAIKGDSTLVAWGSNEFSGLANGSNPDSDPHWVPTQVKDVAGTGDLTGVVKVDGDMALLNDGSVVTWGLNDAGQLGNGSVIGTTTTHPVAVGGIPPVVQALTAQSIASSETNDAVLGTDGTMWAWGGALANGQASDSSTPHQITGLTATDDDIVSVGAGFGSAFAVIP